MAWFSAEFDCFHDPTGPEGPVLRVARRVDQAVVVTSIAIVALTIATLFTAIFVNVLLRYLFATGIIWAYEIPAILFPWMVAGGAVLASQARRHIAMELLASALSKVARRGLGILVNLIIIVVAVAVIDAAQPILRASQFSRLAETGIPQSYGYASLVFAFAMIALTALTSLVRLVLDGRAAEDAVPPSA